MSKKKTIESDVFGKLTLWNDDWTSSKKILINLWDKEYELELNVINDAVNGGVNKLQEESYIKFIKNMSENKKSIEAIVSNFFNTKERDVLVSKFLPYMLLLNINGECALIAENADDEDIHDILPGLAVVIYPKIAVFTHEDYNEYVYFANGDDIKNILYGVENTN